MRRIINLLVVLILVLSLLAVSACTTADKDNTVHENDESAQEVQEVTPEPYEAPINESIDLLLIIAHARNLSATAGAALAIASLKELFGQGDADDFVTVAAEGMAILEAENSAANEIFAEIESSVVGFDEFEEINAIYDEYNTLVDDYFIVGDYEIETLSNFIEKMVVVHEKVQGFFDANPEFKELLTQEQNDIIYPPEPEETEEAVG